MHFMCTMTCAYAGVRVCTCVCVCTHVYASVSVIAGIKCPNQNLVGFQISQVEI